ncbi:MAG TPA: hypothetical protein PLK76_03300 [bacterium]|mgnify:CR=1 FL=1|nr:hypothetical protein [bacterium]
MLNAKKLSQLNQYIEAADIALQQAREILKEAGATESDKALAKNKAKTLSSSTDATTNSKIIEGVFNGQDMIGPDGKEYSVPANYASKSKLVAGDILKLTIETDGSFVYKQIKPIDRERFTGELLMDEVTGNYVVMLADGRKFNVLTASVTYFKGASGDKVTILIGKDQTSAWAAIENIVKNTDPVLAKEVKEILPPIEIKELPASPEKKEIESLLNDNDGLDLDHLNLDQSDLEDL